jgi:pimeloyl-ACP methyl ester carboxylesterase
MAAFIADSVEHFPETAHRAIPACYPLAMTFVKFFLTGLVIFGGFVALMYVVQRSLMYHPERSRTPPDVAGLFDAQDVVLDTADGEKVIAWYVPPRDGKPLVLYFHGNAGALQHRADRFRALIAPGNGLLALSYRGYGGSTGSPSEAGLIADAEAAYRFAVARAPAGRIVAFGESLGSGVAVALAATHKVGAVVLEAPFTSAADVGAAVYWFLPVRLLMRDPFYSDRRIGDVKVPLLILHGTFDRIVPMMMGERLFALANEPKRFVRFNNAGHVNLDQFGAMPVIQAFIAEVLP